MKLQQTKKKRQQLAQKIATTNEKHEGVVMKILTCRDRVAV